MTQRDRRRVAGYRASVETKASQPTFPMNFDSKEPISEVVQALIALLAEIRSAAQASDVSGSGDGPGPMLTVSQTATLLGISRMTVTRMADAGELPCVIVSRGSQKKTRRFPRALIENLALHGSPIVDVLLSDTG